MDRVKNARLIEEALEKIGEDHPDDRRLKSIIYVVLASYHMGDIKSLSDIISLYMSWLKRKIEEVESSVKVAKERFLN